MLLFHSDLDLEEKSYSESIKKKVVIFGFVNL